jgi:nucleoside-diphosphate-sugar epimerase
MILVTGGTGLLGGHILHCLLQEYPRVAALRRPSSNPDTVREIFSFYPGDAEAKMARIEWRTGDLLDRPALEKSLDGVTLVVNCAAVVSFNPRDRQLLIRNNADGARNLSLCGVPVIHISSTSALGDGPGNDPRFRIDEETPRNPSKRHSGYSESKFLSERVLLESGIPVVILNPGIILGPGQWNRGSSLLIEQARKGISFYPFGGTGYVDVRDVADVTRLIAARLIRNEDCGEGQQASDSLLGQRFCLVGANLRYREFFNRMTDEFGTRNPSLYAGKLLTELAWRAEALQAAITRTQPRLTSEAARSSQRIGFFSSGKIRQCLNFEFRPVEETIAWVAGCREKALDLNR